MPTGYTSDLYDGKSVAFEDFVLGCARAFGAWVHQRDEGAGNPRAREISNYTVNNLAEAKQKLKSWLKANDDDKYDMWRDYADATEKRNSVYLADVATRNIRFQAMLDKVEQWSPPDGLENLQNFMREQLSYDIDKKPYVSEVIDYDEWLDTKDRGVRDSVKYARERYDAEVESSKKSNEFTADLYASLGLTYKE